MTHVTQIQCWINAHVFKKVWKYLLEICVAQSINIYTKLINNSLPARTHLYENRTAKTSKQIPPDLNPLVENRASSGWMP